MNRSLFDTRVALDPAPARMRFADLFCGIGGFHIAAVGMGMQPVFACDIDPTAQRVYEDNFGMSPEGDITAIWAGDIPEHDILFAGIPCQPFSAIGDGRGLADPRGALFFEVMRVVRSKRPSVVVIENVRRFTTNQQSRAIRCVVTTLERLGYGVDWKVLNARYFGLPQNRERVFIVARRGAPSWCFPWPDADRPMTPLVDILEPDPPAECYASPRIRSARRAAHQTSVRPAIWHENKSGQVTSHPYSCALRATASYNYLLVDGERRMTAREMLRLQGFPESFHLEAPNTAARHLTGNAVAAPVVEAILKQITAHPGKRRATA